VTPTPHPPMPKIMKRANPNVFNFEGEESEGTTTLVSIFLTLMRMTPKN
jgi:hypothetical protein